MDFDGKLLYNANSANVFSKSMMGCEVDDKFGSKRCAVFMELFQTESSYLIQMEILLKFFYYPLKSNKILEDNAFDVLFGNITQLYNVNRELVVAMHKDESNILSIFTTLGPYLKLYSIYAYNYKKALTVLEEHKKKNKKFAQFVSNQESRPEVLQTIISLLIAPIQRVPRYRLLLEALLEATPFSHPQRIQTQDALKLVEETANHINRMIIESDDGEELIKLAKRFGSNGEKLVIAGRKILKQGRVRQSIWKGSTNRWRFLVLFTDAILIARGRFKNSLSICRLMPLHTVTIEDLLGSLFKLTHHNDTFILYAAELHEGELWIAAIKDAIHHHAVRRQTLRKENTQRNLNKQRLMHSAHGTKTFKTCSI